MRKLRVIGLSSVVAIGLMGVTAGTSGASQGAFGKELLIGVSVPESGPAAAYQTLAYGVKAEVAAVNAAGGVDGYKLKVSVQNNGYDPATSVSVARAFASDGALGIVTAGTPPTQGIRVALNQLKVPVVASAVGEVIDPAEPYLFGTLPRIGQIAEADTTFAVKSLHATKVGLVYEDDEVGIPASQDLPKFAKSLGANLVASESAEVTTTDFAPIANRLASSKATVVQVVAGPTIIAGVQKAAAAIGYKPKWVVLFVADSPAYVSLVGSLANGVYVDQDQLGAGTPQFAQFKAAVTKVAPAAEVNDSFAQQGWTATAILVAGVKKATAGGKALTPASFLAALDSLKAPSVGLIPDISITPKNHVAVDTSGILEISGKTFKQASPFVTFSAGK